jgi:D-xylose transport system permease protein
MSIPSLASGHEGGVLDQIQGYFRRVKNGEMGALPAIGALIFLTGLFASLSPFFLTKLNFANLFVQAAQLAMLAAALVFVLLLAEIDLSAGVTAGVAMAAFFLLLRDGWYWVIALGVAFMVGALVGFIIGFFVAKVGIPSFVITLGFFLGFQGVQLILLGEGGLFRVDVPEIKAIMNANLPEVGGWIMLVAVLAIAAALGFFDRFRRAKKNLPNRPVVFLVAKLGFIALGGGIVIYILNENRSVSVLPISGVPIVIPIAMAVLILATLLLDRTQFGRHLYAVGGNAEAARRAGIKVNRVKIMAFMIASSLAVLSGLFHVSRIGAVEATAGRTIVLSAVAAAVVGGVSLFGGKGRVAHAVIGALVIVMIDNGLGLLGLPAGVNFLVTGTVLAAAATIDAVSRKRGGSGLFRRRRPAKVAE